MERCAHCHVDLLGEQKFERNDRSYCRKCAFGASAWEAVAEATNNKGDNNDEQAEPNAEGPPGQGAQANRQDEGASTGVEEGESDGEQADQEGGEAGDGNSDSEDSGGSGDEGDDDSGSESEGGESDEGNAGDEGDEGEGEGEGDGAGDDDDTDRRESDEEDEQDDSDYKNRKGRHASCVDCGVSAEHNGRYRYDDGSRCFLCANSFEAWADEALGAWSQSYEEKPSTKRSTY